MSSKNEKITNFKYENQNTNDLIRISFEASEKTAVKELGTLLDVAGGWYLGFPFRPNKRPFKEPSYYAYSFFMALELNQDKETKRWILSAFPLGAYIHRSYELSCKAQSIEEYVKRLGRN